MSWYELILSFCSDSLAGRFFYIVCSLLVALGVYKFVKDWLPW